MEVHINHRSTSKIFVSDQTDLLDCFIGTLAAVHSEYGSETDIISLALAAISIKFVGTQPKPMLLQNLPQRLSQKIILAMKSISLASSLLLGVTLGSLLV